MVRGDFLVHVAVDASSGLSKVLIPLLSTNIVNIVIQAKSELRFAQMTLTLA